MNGDRCSGEVVKSIQCLDEGPALARVDLTSVGPMSMWYNFGSLHGPGTSNQLQLALPLWNMHGEI